ncbi:MAG: hypothetical protein LBV20_05215 [Treponema sp.]|jgi:hypothetical protein|nr:hypothetical protein [Treponema sp.]
MQDLLSYKKNLIIVLNLLFILGVQVLFSLGGKEEIPPPEIIITKVTDTQDRYNSLNPSAPGMVMFETAATTAISDDMAMKIDDELSRQLVMTEKIKPVSMQTWLTAKFSEKKANNPFSLMNAIKAENYAIALQFICKPYLFQCEDFYVLHVNVYSLSNKTSAYPISILRIFETPEDIPIVIDAVLHEMQLRLNEANSVMNKKRIIVDSFSLDFLQLAALESGEFEFINAPFIDQYGISIRKGDDFFSLMLGYILSTTNLYEVMRPADFSEYANASAINSRLAEYRIEGKIQLSAELSILHVTVRNVTNNREVTNIKFPLYDCSLKNLWNAYREISVKIIESTHPASSYGFVPSISAPDQGLYINNVFAGWDTLDNLLLPKGLHEIHTGSYFRADSMMNRFERPAISITEDEKKQNASNEFIQQTDEKNVKIFYVLLDTMDRFFVDREGEYVWNFLQKE